MKFKYLALFILFTFVGVQAGNNKMLFGIWEIIEFKLVQRGVETVSDEKTLRDAGAVWNMHFNADGSFRQDFNMRTNDMKMESETGFWSTVNDSLFIDLKVDTFVNRLNYSYIILGDVVVFSMQNSRNKDKIETRFRRK